MENAIDKIESYGPAMKPAVVIFHSLTNDIKSQLDAEGCVKMMSTLIEKTLGKFPDTKIVLSIATPRMDRDRAKQVYLRASSPYLPNGKYLINERINHAFVCSGM